MVTNDAPLLVYVASAALEKHANKKFQLTFLKCFCYDFEGAYALEVPEVLKISPASDSADCLWFFCLLLIFFIFFLGGKKAPNPPIATKYRLNINSELDRLPNLIDHIYSILMVH